MPHGPVQREKNEVEAPMMASGRNAKKSRSAPPVVTRNQGLPWLTIGAVVVVILLLAGAGVGAALYLQGDDDPPPKPVLPSPPAKRKR